MDPALIWKEIAWLRTNPVWKSFNTSKLRLHCGFVVQQCGNGGCTFRLPHGTCSGDAFKQHFLTDHASFLRHRLVARADESEYQKPSESQEFDFTDLDSYTLFAHQYDARVKARKLKGPRENFAYLEVLHEPLGLVCYVCSLCSFCTDEFFAVKAHVVWEHVHISLDHRVPLGHGGGSPLPRL
jgi:hypothetical protein